MQMNVQEVTLDPLTGGPGHNWKVNHGGQSGSDPAHFPHIALDPKTGPWLIHFKISDPGNSITFTKDDPIRVQANSKPTAAGIDPQINAVVPSADGKELFVLDMNNNKDPKVLYYSLQTTHGPVDPIIDNGGHPVMPPGGTYSSNTITLNYVSLALVLLAALLIGAALGWAIKRRA